MSLAWVAVVAGLAWVGFAYVGYPLALAALARLSPRPLRREPGWSPPPVSVIVAVHDGADPLHAKLENLLACARPGPTQILVASDGSRDGTDDVARSFADRGVELIALPERGGKEAAQAAAIARAKGEILIFTDVGAHLDPDALAAIVAPFADPEVGCVSSEDVVDGGSGEGAYVRFEMALRRLENRSGSLVGLSGSFFAVRRALATPWPEDLASDFRSALEAARRGWRAVSAPEARARFGVIGDASAEWQRKVRTVRRGLAVLSAYRELLHPRYGRVALALWGHKLARFTSPFALLAVAFGSAAAAPSSGPALALVAGQVAAYGLGGLALAVPALQGLAPARIAGFFMLVNASMLVAWLHHLGGRRAVTWSPTRR